MNCLICGNEPEERLKLLLSLTNIRSPQIIKAMYYHFVNGYDEKYVVQFEGVTQSNFNRACSTLNEVTITVEKIKELDWVKFNYKSVK